MTEPDTLRILLLNVLAWATADDDTVVVEAEQLLENARRWVETGCSGLERMPGAPPPREKPRGFGESSQPAPARLELLTVDERDLWKRVCVVAVADGLVHAEKMADAAVRAYRERAQRR